MSTAEGKKAIRGSESRDGGAGSVERGRLCSLADTARGRRVGFHVAWIGSVKYVAATLDSAAPRCTEYTKGARPRYCVSA